LVAHNPTLRPDGNVVATGGGGRNTDPLDQSQAVFVAEMGCGETDTWTTMAANEVPRLYHSTAVMLPDGSNHEPLTAEFYAPYLFKGPQPLIGSAPAGVWRHVPGDSHERVGDRDRVAHPARLADPRVDTS
jgi:hypothetical protein